MVNYSIVMRPINTNLFEINQAKARVKAAKTAGEEPKSEDVALVATEVQKAFAVAQYSEVMTIDKFAKHIANHGCVYSRADIAAILYLAVDEMREQLLDGKKMRLGDLGDFSISLTSKGAENADKFTSANITGVNVVWEPGADFKNLLGDAEFNLVASRSAQAALLKALKAGESKVDLDATTGGDDKPSGDGGDYKPSGDGGSTPGGDTGSGSNPGSSDSDDGGVE